MELLLAVREFGGLVSPDLLGALELVSTRMKAYVEVIGRCGSGTSSHHLVAVVRPYLKGREWPGGLPKIICPVGTCQCSHNGARGPLDESGQYRTCLASTDCYVMHDGQVWNVNRVLEEEVAS